MYMTLRSIDLSCIDAPEVPGPAAARALRCALQMNEVDGNTLTIQPVRTLDALKSLGFEFNASASQGASLSDAFTDAMKASVQMQHNRFRTPYVHAGVFLSRMRQSGYKLEPVAPGQR
jgi:hypothetical protein